MEAVSQGEEDKQEEEVEEVDGDGRRRRKRKVPKRYIKIKAKLLLLGLLITDEFVQVYGSSARKRIGKDIQRRGCN